MSLRKKGPGTSFEGLSCQEIIYRSFLINFRIFRKSDSHIDICSVGLRLKSIEN